MLTIRRAGLERFGETAIKTDRPMALIEDAFVPLYLHHRYAVDSAVTVLGGQDYIYAMRGDGRTPVRWVPAAAQTKALDALMSTLKLNELALSSSLLGKIPPRPPGYGRTRELFPRTTGGASIRSRRRSSRPTWSSSGMLTNDRAARMVAQHAVDPALPGLDDVIDRLVATVFDATPATPYEAEIKRAMERVVIDRVMTRADRADDAGARDRDADAAAAADALHARRGDRATAGRAGASPAHRRRHQALLRSGRGHDAARRNPQPPPGAPIGDYDLDYLLGLDSCILRMN